MNPRGPSRASKSQKTAFSKKWFSRGTFTIFSLLGPPKRASRGPRRLPKDTQRTPRPQKRDPKLDPKIIKKLDQFWGNLRKKNGKQLLTKNRNIFWTPFPRISGVQIMPRQKVNERGKKAFLTEIILYKRKGGIRPYKAF